MKFIISGKNIEVTPGLKSTVEQKLGKLERYFTPETEIIVTLRTDKQRYVCIHRSCGRSDRTSASEV